MDEERKDVKVVLKWMGVDVGVYKWEDKGGMWLKCRGNVV